MTTSLYWFRRDLRLDDNAALAAAVSSSTTVYAVFCHAEFDMLNDRQRSFVAATLRSMRQALQNLDASLSMLEGDLGGALVDASKRLGATRVYCARSFGRGERVLEELAAQALSGAGIELCRLGGTVVHEPELVAERKQGAGAGYRVFPPFYDAWKKLAVPRPVAPAAPTGRDPQPGAIPEDLALGAWSQPSEAAAREAMQTFVTARAADYGANCEYPGRPATSLLGPYLRFGLLSPRALYHAVAERMARSWTIAQERLSMEMFLRRLALRDFFIQLAFYAPHVHDEALQEKMRGFAWSHDERLVAAWFEGKTGYPLVDAAMRQLRSEGHVHQRAAVCAASFCTCDLGLDWRIGRDLWMRELLEADEAICDGNWQRIAGIGSDQAAYPRIYNPVRQAQLFDSQATYVRHYCRELAKLPTRAALAPWELGRQQQIELGFLTPQQYPAPIVDHEEAGRAFLKKYQAYRNRA